MTRTAGARVLLVEDSEDDTVIVERAFRILSLGHELTVVETGEEALQMLEAGRLRPDLVLLDINLPAMSGIEVLRRVKADPRLRTIPVIVLTASDRDRDVHEAYEAGANHYLVKPIRFEDFIDLVDRWSEYWTKVGRLPSKSLEVQ